MAEIKLGKLPAKVDKRTIPLRAILKKELLPPLPNEYNIDEALGGIDDDRMFANDRYGCCVISARAHQTLRFEKYEQGSQPVILDQEVIDQYLKETGGLNTGLYLLDSLKEWRKNGWLVGGKIYNIYAFASVDWRDHQEAMHCIHLLGGVNFGMKVYQTDLDQFDAGEPWHLTGHDGAYKGGHGVYAYNYEVNSDGITLMTWGKRQPMTWDFWDARVDEAFGIVDNRDDWVEDSPVDVEKLDTYLKEITQGNEEESTCSMARGFVKICNFALRELERNTRLKAVRRG